ncbi:hypothetical protein [Variovorax sp. ZT4R33]|uniref:hypothetical protein n=1 Tax=Variovorax sp. ZT4R33 TaxID=3443743 RepID=UPI003F48987C
MHTDQLTMGAAFSEWAHLTHEYAAALDALRRLEPGASLRLVQIGRRMESCRRAVLTGPEAVDVETVALPAQPRRLTEKPATSWFASAFSPLLASRSKAARHHASA